MSKIPSHPAATALVAGLAGLAALMLAGCGAPGGASAPAAPTSAAAAGAAQTSPAIAPPAAWTLSPRKLDEGTQSGITERRTVAIRSADEWTAFYKAHKPGETPIAVDFSQEMVLAVLPGEKPSGGYTVSIVGVQEEAGVITAKYKETAPGPDAMSSAVLTQPYALVSVPKSDKRVDFLAADGTR